LLLRAVVVDARAQGRRGREEEVPDPVRADLLALGAAIAPMLTAADLARAVMGWTQLIGSISFELFGHLHNVIHDYQAYFEFQMSEVAAGLGL